MAWTYTFYYNKDSDFDEVAVYRRIKEELQHPFEISAGSHTECVIESEVQLDEATRSRLQTLINE